MYRIIVTYSRTLENSKRTETKIQLSNAEKSTLVTTHILQTNKQPKKKTRKPHIYCRKISNKASVATKFISNCVNPCTAC